MNTGYPQACSVVAKAGLEILILYVLPYYNSARISVTSALDLQGQEGTILCYQHVAN